TQKTLQPRCSNSRANLPVPEPTSAAIGGSSEEISFNIRVTASGGYDGRYSSYISALPVNRSSFISFLFMRDRFDPNSAAVCRGRGGDPSEVNIAENGGCYNRAAKRRALHVRAFT